jgi:2-oxoglutarate ferredoxin oxidoreductase subunit alpha
MIPVMYLSDGYLANGSEPWKFPQEKDLKDINVRFEPPRKNAEEPFLPYLRDENHVRSWAIPGTEGIEHRVGGLEKEDETGNVSYDPDNHEKMVKTREAKRDKVADFIPHQEIDQGNSSGEVLVLGWGSTYGSIRTAVGQLRKEGLDISHAHLNYISPFPKNLEELMRGFATVIVPEINNGQLVRLIRDQFLIPAQPVNKIKGRPFGVQELKDAILKITSVKQEVGKS